MTPTTILFVCTGNICRSPFAEAVARRALSEHFQVVDLEEVGLQLASAGTHALSEHPATPEMQSVAQEIGLDLSQHRAAQLLPETIDATSLILAMETHHIAWLRAQEAPLAELLGTQDIADPYGMGLREYRRARDEILAAINSRLPELISLAG